MKIPTQAKPVQRGVSTSAFQSNMTPSGIPCTLCKAACNSLSGMAKTLCILACDNTVC